MVVLAVAGALAGITAVVRVSADRLTTDAERIETPAQLRQLQDLDCALGQGYLFSRPLPAEAIPRDPRGGGHTCAQTPKQHDRCNATA